MKIEVFLTTISLTLATSFFYSPQSSAMTLRQIGEYLGLINPEPPSNNYSSSNTQYHTFCELV